MGKLVVIEGLDGSGKHTLTASLTASLSAKGRRVTSLAFPRYGASMHADLVREMLYGRLGDLSDSVYGGALLFALDRQGAAGQIRAALDDHDVVLLDRYVSSNAAYGSARLGAPQVPTDFAEWVRELEIGRFGLPLPDRQILLATDVQVAAGRAVARAKSDTDRALDAFEADQDLQHRTAAVYRQLAAASFLSPWSVLEPNTAGELILPDL